MCIRGKMTQNKCVYPIAVKVLIFLHKPLSLLQHQQTSTVCTWKWTMLVKKYLEYYTQVSLQVSNIKWFSWMKEKLTKRLKIYSLKVLSNKIFLNEGLLTKYIVLK